ncbi:MAG: hypothetical protein Q9201_005075 [Fulgogasparrea decipioides]
MVWERPRPTRVIPATPIQPVQTQPTVATADTYEDPFAGLTLFSSLRDSDDDGVDKKAKGSVKKPAPKKTRSLVSEVPGNKEAQKKDKPPPKQPQPATATAHQQTNTDQSHPQDVHKPLSKRVSFSDQVTRGPGRSYTPPIDEKRVRFSDELVRGEGAGYSNLSPSKSEVYPYATAAFEAPKTTRRASPPKKVRFSIDASASTKDLKPGNMGIKKQSTAREVSTDLEIMSDSDESFTDIVIPVTAPAESRPQRPNRSIRPHRPSAGPMDSARLRKFMPGYAFAVGDTFHSATGTTESHIDNLTAANTRRNSITEALPALEQLDEGRRQGTAAVPVYNRYGHRIRAPSVDTNMFDGSARSSWPEPVFVFRGSNAASVPGRAPPVFVLRDRSNSRNNVEASGRPTAAKSAKQQSRRKYQQPSVIDDEVNETIRYDPLRNVTYRDV